MANGATANANSVEAARNSGAAALLGPSPMASAPKMAVGTYRGRAIRLINRPPRRTVAASAAPTPPQKKMRKKNHLH